MECKVRKLHSKLTIITRLRVSFHSSCGRRYKSTRERARDLAKHGEGREAQSPSLSAGKMVYSDMQQMQALNAAKMESLSLYSPLYYPQPKEVTPGG